MSVNIKDDFNAKLKIVDNEENYDKIQEYMNNYDYKISYINIDSRFRNIYPQNVVKMQPNYLPLNPITTYSNEYRIRVNLDNNMFNIGDKIVLQNIVKNPIILSKSVYLINNYNYYMVNMNNHNLLASYTTSDNFKVLVESYDSLSITDRLIGNIPINSILGYYSIHIYNNDETFLPNVIKNIIFSELNINDTQLTQNYFFIQLPFNYININQINTSTVFPTFNNVDKIFTFTFNNIGCINLYYLNANYPINNTQYQAYHEITDVGDKYIEFNSPSIALFSETNGGSNIIIGKVLTIIEGYPNINNYSINLKKSFTDVYSIEIVSSEFPYIDNNIKSKNNITISNTLYNDKLYWKYLEDGDYIYSITLDEGTYYLDSLVSILKIKMNNIERIYSTPDNIVYTEFDIKYDSNSQEFKFYSYKTDLNPYSLSLEQDLSLGSQVLKLIIRQKGNYVSVGDSITISNADDIGDISSTLINKTHTIYSINTEASSYTVILITNQFLQNINLSGDGGAKTTIRTPVLTSFLFNYNDTIGSLLGFKYVGSSTSITPFAHITSNMNPYIYPTIYNEVGERTISNNYFNFNGMNYYILMYLNDYENIYTTNNFKNAFAKILMKGHPGDILYNTFIKHSPLIFDIPLKTLSELKISYLYPDGTSPDFRNIEHSFTLKIVERLSKPTRTGLNSMKMNYLDSMKEVAFNNSLLE